MVNKLIVYFYMLVIWISIIITNKFIYPYTLNKLEKYRKKSYIPLIHSISISILSTIGLFYNENDYYNIISIWSLSYFTIDIFSVIYNKEYLFILHHLIGILGISYVILFESNNLLLLNYCLMTEISTPFLYRWKLSKLNNKNKEYKYFIEFSIIFLIIRPFFLIYILLNHYHKFIYSYSLLLYLFLLLLNIGWSLGIIHIGFNYKKKVININ